MARVRVGARGAGAVVVWRSLVDMIVTPPALMALYRALDVRWTPAVRHPPRPVEVETPTEPLKKVFLPVEAWPPAARVGPRSEMARPLPRKKLLRLILKLPKK